MIKDKTRGYCPRCKHQQVFVKATVNHPLHAVISVLTGGLWLVSWVAISIGKVMRPWRCEHCGWYKPLPNPVDTAGTAPGKAVPAGHFARFRSRRRSEPCDAGKTRQLQP